MPAARILLALLLSLAPAILIGACNQGTEVGNPEVTVVARFALRDSDAAVSMTAMKLKVMGMGWNLAGDSATCWDKKPDGVMVDFMNGRADQLPAVAVARSDWSKAELLMQPPSGDPLPAILPSYAAWDSPRYAKILKVMGADTLRFLFDMPKDVRLKLLFNKGTISTWRAGDTVTVAVLFDLAAWSAGLGSDPGFVFRADGEHVRYVLLSPTENAAAYQAMLALLPKAFMADSSVMQ